MMTTFKVCIDYHNVDGYVEYNDATKDVTVVLPDEPVRKAVADYLQAEHQIRIACGQAVADFKEAVIKPLDSIEHFKLALTRMWQEIGVSVQWSRVV